MKYTVTVSVQVVGDIEVEADSIDEATSKAKSLAKFERGERLMLTTVDSDPLSVTDEDGNEHEVD